MTTVPPEPRAVPPGVETLTVKVNGRALAVPRTTRDPLTGRFLPTSILQACQLAQVDVPHYCYHPRLPVAGNCRMCLVDFGTTAVGPDRQPLRKPDGSLLISRSPRPAIACATPVSAGMEVYTNTPEVRQMREAVLEFLLINHPLDCPICDQAGECKLQEYSVQYGQAHSQFVESKVHKPKRVELGPRIMLDDERCILCTRCIRFTRDIIGEDALGIVNRGSHSTLTAYPGRPFDHNYTLNTVDLCPVGALTSKDFRFQMRVWFLKETKSLCTSCGAGCNVLLGSREGRVLRYVPRENDAVNASWMCDAGRLNYPWIGRPDRLRQVQRRDGAGQLTPTPWPTALRELAERLGKARAGSVAIIASGRQTNEELFLLSKLARRLGALTDSPPRVGEGDRLLVSADKNPNSVGAQLTGLAATPAGANLARVAEGLRTGQITTLLVFGEDLTRHGVPADLLGKAELLVVSDILPNRTVEQAHLVLPGCAHAEKRGSFTTVKGRVQRFFQAVEPPGDARPEWEFLSELLEVLAGPPAPREFAAVFRQMAQEVPGFQGLSWAGLGDTGMMATIGA